MPANASADLVARAVCPVPFLPVSLYPPTGGYVEGRFCAFDCCLPCPQTNWLYPDNFNTVAYATNWVNVLGLICSLFLIVSFAFLPVSKTHRHYLSVCLAIATVFIQLGFIIPLGAKPNQCFNDITPNDMRSSKTCALSGAFLLLGGWSGVMWVFLRAVALHLQICWQVVLGKNFMWGAMASGWGIPAVGLTLAMIFSGVSFRFGDTCHINHPNSLADFWIPLLVFSAVTVVVQFITFGYCLKVYLASLADSANTTSSSGLPAYSNSVPGTISPRQAYRRVSRVIHLQWRGIAIVLLIVGEIIFFAVVFVSIDRVESKLLKDPTDALPWIICLRDNRGDKSKCTDISEALVMNEATVAAVLLFISLNGLWCLLFLGRGSMFTGWWEKVRGTVGPSHKEFVSADVRNFKDPGTYEMLGRERDTGKSPEPLALSPLSPLAAMPPPTGRETPDYFGRDARYKSPPRSFSAPKSPDPIARDWDPTSTYAPPRANPLGMHKM